MPILCLRWEKPVLRLRWEKVSGGKRLMQRVPRCVILGFRQEESERYLSRTKDRLLQASRTPQHSERRRRESNPQPPDRQSGALTN